jgi:hypothetical protein
VRTVAAIFAALGNWLANLLLGGERWIPPDPDEMAANFEAERRYLARERRRARRARRNRRAVA